MRPLVKFRIKAVRIVFLAVMSLGLLGLVIDSLRNWPYWLETSPWVIPHYFPSAGISRLSIIFLFVNLPAFTAAWGVTGSFFSEIGGGAFKIVSVLVDLGFIYCQWLLIDRIVFLLVSKKAVRQ